MTLSEDMALQWGGGYSRGGLTVNSKVEIVGGHFREKAYNFARHIL